MQNNTPRKMNTLALVGFIAALIQVPLGLTLLNLLLEKSMPVFLVLFVPVVSIVLIVINAIAIRQAKKKAEKGSGLAITGIIVSALTFLLGVIFSLMMIALASDQHFPEQTQKLVPAAESISCSKPIA